MLEEKVGRGKGEVLICLTDEPTLVVQLNWLNPPSSYSQEQKFGVLWYEIIIYVYACQYQLLSKYYQVTIKGCLLVLKCD